MATTTKSPNAANINTGTSESANKTSTSPTGKSGSFSERASAFATGTVDKAKERPIAAAAIVGGVAAAAAAAVYGGTKLAQNRSSKSKSSSKKSS